MTKYRYADLENRDPEMTIAAYNELFNKYIKGRDLNPASDIDTRILVERINLSRATVKAGVELLLPKKDENTQLIKALASATRLVRLRMSDVEATVSDIERNVSENDNPSSNHPAYQQLRQTAAIAIQERQRSMASANQFLEAVETLRGVGHIVFPDIRPDFPTGWPDILRTLVMAFREAMGPTNPTDEFRPSPDGPLARFLAAVMPCVTGEQTAFRHPKTGRAPSAFATEAARQGL